MESSPGVAAPEANVVPAMTPITRTSRATVFRTSGGWQQRIGHAKRRTHEAATRRRVRTSHPPNMSSWRPLQRHRSDEVRRADDFNDQCAWDSRKRPMVGRSEADSPVAKHRRRESRWGPPSAPPPGGAAPQGAPLGDVRSHLPRAPAEGRLQAAEARPALLRSASAPATSSSSAPAATPRVAGARSDTTARPPAASPLLRPDSELSAMERQQRHALLAVRAHELLAMRLTLRVTQALRLVEAARAKSAILMAGMRTCVGPSSEHTYTRHSPSARPACSMAAARRLMRGRMKPYRKSYTPTKPCSRRKSRYSMRSSSWWWWWWVGGWAPKRRAHLEREGVEVHRGPAPEEGRRVRREREAVRDSERVLHDACGQRAESVQQWAADARESFDRGWRVCAGVARTVAGRTSATAAEAFPCPAGVHGPGEGGCVHGAPVPASRALTLGSGLLRHSAQEKSQMKLLNVPIRSMPLGWGEAGQ